MRFFDAGRKKKKREEDRDGRGWTMVELGKWIVDRRTRGTVKNRRLVFLGIPRKITSPGYRLEQIVSSSSPIYRMKRNDRRRRLRQSRRTYAKERSVD